MTGDWLKSFDPSTFEQQRRLLFLLGHFVSDEYPEIDQETFDRLKRSVVTSRHRRFREATMSYQMFNCAHLKSTRVLMDADFGPVTQSTVKTRFCGAPDITPARLQAGTGPAWGKKHLTVWHDMATLRGLTFDEAKSLDLEAVGLISDVCGLTFQWGSDYDIYAHARGIDGENGVLAWSYLPNSTNYNGTIERRFDNRENYSGRGRTFFRPVDAHEHGHAVGMEHSSSIKDLMYPQITGVQKFGPGDIRVLQAKYGKPTTEPDDPDPDDSDSIKDGESVTLSGVIKKVKNVVFMEARVT